MTTLQPPSILLMGRPGSGKSYSLHTLLRAGLEVFILGTEPGFIDTVLDACAATGTPTDRLHWHQLEAATPGFDALKKVAEMVAVSSYQTLADLKDGIAKREMKGWMNLLHAIKDFPDDRTGTRFGDVTDWGPDRAFVIDSLSGVNELAKQLTVGFKPNLHQGEWGTAMEVEWQLLRELVSNRKCFFVLTCHQDRTIDDVTQQTNVTVAALGNKLGPKIPKEFSEVVVTKRPQKTGDAFVWSTIEPNTDTKNRALPVSATLPADFGPIVAAYKKRAAAATQGAPT